MTRDDDPGRAGPVASQSDGDELDPLLVRAFSAAFDRDLPVDVEARHLWQLYRSARPSVIDGLAAAPHPGRLQRVLARVAITAVVTLVPSVLAAASADALPGDVLYAVKRHNQLAQVELAVSWTERDAALAELAELRLDEARAVVVSRPRAAARVVADAAAALDELERSPLSTGSLQARRMRHAAAREVAALLDDVPDLDRGHLQVAFEELSDGGLDSPVVASAQLSPGADDHRSATLRQRQPREPSSPDAARSAAPGTPGPAVDDRQLLARARDDEPDAASPEPPATRTPSRPAGAPADAVATAPRPAGTAPAAMAPAAPPAQQPVAAETEAEDPPPATAEAPSELGSEPAVGPEPSTEPSDDDDADQPARALPRPESPSTTVSPEPTAAPSPAPTAEPTPASSATPTTSPSAQPSQQPKKSAVPATKSATKAWKSGLVGRGPIAPSGAPAATEVP